MNKERFRSIILSFIVVITIQCVTGCGEEEIKSYWLENDITIDGDQMDWQGKLQYLADEHSALGIANDEQNLYLCLVTNDTLKMFQFFVTGFTVWFEPKNGGEKIGVQYPLKSDDIRKMMQKGDRREGNIPDSKLGIGEFKKMQNELRIINEDNFPMTAYSLNNEIGIKVDVGYQRGQFVYEMQIPILKPLFSYHNLNLLPGDKITLAFESGEFDRGDLGGQNRGSGFGMNGRGGGKGGGRGGGNRGGSMPPSIEKIDFEVQFKLAQNPRNNKY